MNTERIVVETDEINEFHDWVCSEYPWWSSGIMWEKISGAVARQVNELSEVEASKVFSSSAIDSCEHWALILTTTKPALVYRRDEIVMIADLVEVPLTAFLVCVSTLRPKVKLSYQGFIGIALRGGRWELGTAPSVSDSGAAVQSNRGST